MTKELFNKLFKHSADTGTGSGSALSEPAEVAGDDEAGQDSFKAPRSQSELDSIINRAVHKALDNHKKGEQERIAEAIKKEQDYAKLSTAERERKKFEEQQSQFEKERAAFEHEKLLVQVTRDLAEKSLPVELAEIFAVPGDPEKSLEAVGVFQKAFDAAVAKAVEKSLRQSEPSFGGTSATSGINFGQKLAQNSGAKANTKPF